MKRISRASCEQLDCDDPLVGFRRNFKLGENLIYLDGNSLGPLPAAAAARALQVVEEEWGVDLIRSWNKNNWFQLPHIMGDKIARLIGAEPGEVVMTDSTGINLHKVLHAALGLRPDRRIILMEDGNFPTNNYVGQGVAALRSGGYQVQFADPEDLLDALSEDVAVLCLTHVHYRTGRIHDMDKITAAAQALGIIVVWDLCHSAGALPVNLNDCQVDFAVGCTYKYLNGGPGSPAYLFAARRHHGHALQPLAGWWGHDNPFALERDYRAAPGIKQMLTGTQPVLSLAVAETGIDMFLATDMNAVRRKSIALCDLFVRLVEQHCAGQGLQLISPRDSNMRGSQVSFDHDNGYAIMQALIDAEVIGDFRAPATLRFGFAPLYTRYVDVWDAVMRLQDILQSECWREARFQIRETVT